MKFLPIAIVIVSVFSTQAFATCPDIQGTWRGVDHWSVLKINSSTANCSFFGTDNGENPYFSHVIKGQFVGAQVAKVTVFRTSLDTACTTLMYGTLSLIGADEMQATYTSTDGKCDLSVDFSSTIHLRRD